MPGMRLALTKQSLDIGIVVRDAPGCLAFYRDVLGLEHVATVPMPGGATMERLACGDSVIKLLSLAETPAAANPPGGNRAATGLRYFTMFVEDLDDVVNRCREAGAPIPLGPLELRPGLHLVMVEDPDGNWVEFVKLDG
jgi:glyoxylase I family protein